MAKDTPLEVKIENEELVIRIGTSTLCTAIRQCAIIDEAVMDANGDESVVKIDVLTFSQAILEALEVEEEDGSTPIHRMFDAAAEYAIEQGAEGIEIHEPNDDEDDAE